MECVNISKKKNILYKFKDIDLLINNIDSFEEYNFKKSELIDNKKNQLFTKNPPPYELVNKVLYTLINKDLGEDIHYEFSRRNIKIKNIIDKVNNYIPELKQFYLKCKHKKYLEDLNEKKIITLFRQLLRLYNYSLNSVEKYNNGQKYLLYIIQKKKILTYKKIDSFINFD
jgi:hypothetical protein